MKDSRDAAAKTAPPRVSVIIPTHNRAAVLPRALTSVLDQKEAGRLFELEVIVVDDGSTDDTPAVLQRFPQIRYLRLPGNRGVSAARNEGLTASTGRYLAFLDDDDLWLPYKLALQVPHLEAHPEAGLLYGQNIVTLDAAVYVWPNLDSPSGRVFEKLLLGNFVPIRTVLVRRTAMEKVGGFDESLASYEVDDLWLRLAWHVSFVFQPGPVAIYRRGTEGLYGRGIASGRARDDARRAIEKALALLPLDKRFTDLRQRARAHVELNFAEELESIQRWEELRLHLVTAVPGLASLAASPAVRAILPRLLARIALGSPAPAAAVRALRDEIGPKASGALGRWEARRIWADVWLRVAREAGRAGHGRAAAGAFVRAVLADPIFIARAATLKGVRRVLGGRRARNSQLTDTA